VLLLQVDSLLRAEYYVKGAVDMKILIVEDNEDSRILLMKQLRAHGHEVTPAANGVEALQQALAQPQDIIVSDILMPKMDGYQLCQEFKQNEQLKNVPFVFYTASYTLDEDKKFALSLRADAFLIKPTEPDVLIQKLREILEKAKAGALAPPEVAPLEPSLFLDEYSKRIFTKLEDKVAQLGREVTQRKEAEERLRQAAEEWIATFSAITDFVCIHDKDFRFIAANRACAEMLKMEPKELVGKTCYKIVHGTNEPWPDCPHRQTLEDGKPHTAEFFEPHLGVHLEVSTSPMFNEKGDVIATVHIARDITERKQAEQKARELQVLKEVDDLRSQLLTNVSHELRTPLASIKGFATTLLRSDVKWSEEDQRDFLQTIDHETNRLIHLINDLLDMSRIEAGGLKLDKRDYQIAEVLDSASSSLASLTEHHQLEIIVPSELPPVFVDQMRIGQVLTNLVENAVKHSGEGIPITIEAQLTGDEITVSVADRGEGIPLELLDKVFDRFYQAESIVDGKKSGTGLGLSICRGIVEAHGGRIWAESKLGEGSKFSFSLPVGKGEGDGA